jgi:hypothetical protein
LKLESVICVGRLAVMEGELLLSEVGHISSERTKKIKNNFADWMLK